MKRTQDVKVTTNFLAPKAARNRWLREGKQFLNRNWHYFRSATLLIDLKRVGRAEVVCNTHLLMKDGGLQRTARGPDIDALVHETLQGMQENVDVSCESTVNTPHIESPTDVSVEMREVVW